MKWQCAGGGGAAGGWVHPGCSAVPVVGRGSSKSSLAFAAFLLSLLLGVGGGRLLSIGLGLFRRLDALPPQQELLLPEVFQIGRRHVLLDWLQARCRLQCHRRHHHCRPSHAMFLTPGVAANMRTREGYPKISNIALKIS